MTKSELIERIVTHQGLLSSKDVELAIKTMLEQMSQCLATGIVSRSVVWQLLPALPCAACRSQSKNRSVRQPRRQVRSAFQAGKNLRDRVNEDEEEVL
jgi:integration host factor subunit beta